MVDVDAAVAKSPGEHFIAGYPIFYTQVSNKKHQFDVVMSPQENITISSFKNLVAVHMDNAQSHLFFNEDISGILGSYGGALVGRDGTVYSESDDLAAFAEEWQVRPDQDGLLFRTVRAPQYPFQCILPSLEAKESRRLGATIAISAAKAACSRFAGAQFDNCVFDAMAVGDLEMAETY